MARPETVATKIATFLDAINNCRKSGNAEWKVRHEERINYLVKNFMPSGAGVDNGTEFHWVKSTPNKLVFITSFHHMDPGGMYDGWTDHTVTVRPCLIHGLDIQLSGRDRNQIKDYLHDLFNSALSLKLSHTWDADKAEDVFEPVNE